MAAGLLIALSVCACTPTVTPSNGETIQGEIKVSGAFALYPLMTRWAEDYQRLNPGMRFKIASGGAGQGMSEILAGKVDIDMISREITAEEELHGAYRLAVAKDAVFPLVNSANLVLDKLLSGGVTRETLNKIFITAEIMNWGEVVGRPEITDEIHVYTRTDICGAAATRSLYLGGAQSDLFETGKFGDPGMLQAVQNGPLGIGYNNLIYAYGLGNAPLKSTVVLPLDSNENGQADPDEIMDTLERAVSAVEIGYYPTPPVRILYLVTRGKPEGEVQAFLTWTMTDGQAYVESSGYMQLPPELLDISLQKIR